MPSHSHCRPRFDYRVPTIHSNISRTRDFGMQMAITWHETLHEDCTGLPPPVKCTRRKLLSILPTTRCYGQPSLPSNGMSPERTSVSINQQAAREVLLSVLLNVVFVANYIQQRQLQMMPTCTYFVKWLIPVIVFTLSFY